MRVGRAHFAGNASGVLDVYQFALPDSWAPAAGRVPFLPAFDQFGPEGKRAALCRFGDVNATAAVFQEFTLGVPGDAQAAQVLCAKNMALFKIRGRHVEVIRESENVILRQIHETLLFTALCASGLALESHQEDFYYR